MSHQLQSLVETLCRRVNRTDRRVLTLAHLLADQLEQGSWASTSAGRACLADLRERVLNADNWAIDASNAGTGNYVAFSIPDAVEDFERYLARQRARSRLADDVVRWLVLGSFDDPSAKAMRHTATEAGLRSELGRGSAPPATEHRATSLPGRLVDRDWAHAQRDGRLVGRDQDLAEHLSFLSLAVRSGRPYAVVGHAGVGKSLFVRALATLAFEMWSTSADPVLRRTRLRLIEDSEFACSLTDCRNRLSDLYDHLLAQADEVPIFDGFDIFLGDKTKAGELFTEYLGSWLSGSVGRSVVVVARTAPVGASPLLRQVMQIALSALPAEHAQEVAARHLREELAQLKPALPLELSVEAFAERIVELAPQRYPGRAMPEIVVNLARGVVRRAEARRYRGEGPDLMSLDDLYRHIAVEQGVSIEIIGKDPVAFYAQQLAAINRRVIGQQHVVRTVMEHLVGVATAARARTLPRGRFLLVGPPGTGKTFFGRMLARALGYGSEGFFKYNMADFAGDGDRWRFQGPPAGYQGHGTRTIFDDVRQRPSCVALLDEVDRAHPLIQDLLLSILEGEGKDSRNEPVNFSQVIFIMTTNQAEDAVRNAYERYLAPFRERDTWPTAEDRMSELTGRERDDGWLRRLLESGVTQDEDAQVHAWLSSRISEQQQRAVAATREVGGSVDPRNEILELLRYRQLRAEVESQVRKSRLDRAFLDRIDGILPVYPLKETDLLLEILENEAERMGVRLDAAQARQAVAAAQHSSEAVRPLLRSLDDARTRGARLQLEEQLEQAQRHDRKGDADS